VLVRLTVAGTGVGTTVTETVAGDVQVDAVDTHLTGIGFDQNNNLIGLSDGDMIFIDRATPTDSSLLGAADTVDADLTAFAIGRSGATYRTFAYDTADGGRFLTNAGLVAVLGSLVTGTGQFTRFRSLVDETAAPLTDDIVDIAVDSVNTDNVFVLTAAGKLFCYSPQGTFVDLAGTVVDSRTRQPLDVTQIEFNSDGELVGLDATFNRLVTINTTSALADGRLPAGSIDAASVAAWSFNAGTGSHYAVKIPNAQSWQQYVRVLAGDRAEYDELVGAITAQGIDSLNINAEDYAGQIVTTGNSFGRVNIAGAFSGILTTPGTMGPVNQRNGDFGGTLIADRGITSVSIADGSFLPSALVQTDGVLGLFNQRGQIAGSSADTFGGIIDVRTLTKLNSAVNAVAAALVNVSGGLGAATFAGDFAGRMPVGSIARALSLRGEFGGSLSVAESAGAVTLTGGAAAASAITLGGDLATLRAGQDFAGSVIVGRNLGVAAFGSMTGAAVIVGFGGNALTATGHVLSTLLSFGTGVGSDGLYNTADDVIYGGTLRSATFRRDFTDSALVAGVLPSLAQGEGLPADTTAYVGDLTTDGLDLANTDSADAGGMFTSDIGSARFGGDVTGSAVAAADAIGALTGLNVRWLPSRAYGDPLGAPTVVSTEPVLNSEDVLTRMRISFSEPVNTGYFQLAVDADDDGQVDGPADTNGNVLVVNEDGTVLDDVTLTYEVETGSHGQTQGVLVITRAEGLSNTVSITLRGTGDSVVCDRSGLRSALRDFDQDGVADIGEDAYGTLFDGDDDRVEGGDWSITYSASPSVLLSGVPKYQWWFGCSATSAAMVIAYYDRLGQYNNLIQGSAVTQEQNVLDAIASPGDGVYEFTGAGGTNVQIVQLGTPGTGHIPDYALYDGVNDEDYATPYPDLSSGAGLVQPHEDDCIADFLGTSQSGNRWGLTMGGTWPMDIGSGVEQYFAYRGYEGLVETDHLEDAAFSWDVLTQEIDAGRPVIIGVDSSGDGIGDHSAVAVGYNAQTHQYAAYTTWTDNPATLEDESFGWFYFREATPGFEWGLTDATLVHVS